MDIEKLIDRLKNYSIKDKALLNLQTVKDAAESLEKLQAENEKLKAYMNDAYGTMYNIYGACGAYCDAEISDFWQRWHSQKEG